MNTLDAIIRDGLAASVTIQPRREVWIAIRTDGIADVDPLNPIVIGEGSFDNPWDGSTALKLDFILRARLADENITIHLGPGVFRTGGSVGVTSLYSQWQPRSGWKMIGSGKYQTTLLLTIYGLGNNLNASGQYGFWMIHSGDRFLDGFELSDLTLDCGMDDQPMPPKAKRSWPQVMCAGFVLAGRNIAVRRVRVVNFGTRAPVWVNGFPTGGYESYPGIFEPIISTPDWLTTADVSFNQLLEDCIFEQPFPSNGREVTPFHSSGRALPIGATHAFAMRRCYFNMDFVNRLPDDLRFNRLNTRRDTAPSPARPRDSRRVLWRSGRGNFKSFNNQKTDGTLLRAYELINSRYLMELQDFTEDALLGF